MTVSFFEEMHRGLWQFGQWGWAVQNYVAWADLGLAIETRLSVNSENCLPLPLGTGIKGAHHTWPFVAVLKGVAKHHVLELLKQIFIFFAIGCCISR